MRRWLIDCWELLRKGLRTSLKSHRWYLLGWIATWLFPLAMISVYLGIETSRKPSVSFKPWLLLVLGIMLIVYYKKIKSTVKARMLAASVRGVPANPLWYLLNGAAEIVVLAVCYWLADIINQFNLDHLLSYIAFCMASVGFGAICYAIDATDNLIRARNLDLNEGRAK